MDEELNHGHAKEVAEDIRLGFPANSASIKILAIAYLDLLRMAREARNVIRIIDTLPSVD